MSPLPRILLLTSGGTIATTSVGTSGALPRLTAHDLMHALPVAETIADIVPIEAFRKSSRAMTPADMCHLAHLIREHVRGDVAGVVVTHGTDTMEETAYALALQLDLEVPVVLTGAMRLPQAPGADGPANLLAALRVATTPQAGSLGPLVVMHDEIHLARFVAKTHTSRVAAFASPGFGPVGSIVEDRVLLHGQRQGNDYLGLPTSINDRVELIWVAAGMDGLLVDAAAGVARGLVVAGTGGGHVPPAMVQSLQAALQRGLPVVLASRTGGPILRDTYGGMGSEAHLLGMGMVPAGLLAPLKARLRLLVALALGMRADAVFPV